MPKFSATSKRRLASCDLRLQYLFNNIIREYDCTIIDGHRPKARQDRLFELGRSRARFPNSKHNSKPSMAVDVVPYIKGTGVSWDSKQCAHFAGYVQAVASVLDTKIRWGGDWDGDHNLNDQKFNDMVHFELIEEEK